MKIKQCCDIVVQIYFVFICIIPFASKKVFTFDRNCCCCVFYFLSGTLGLPFAEDVLVFSALFIGSPR